MTKSPLQTPETAPADSQKASPPTPSTDAVRALHLFLLGPEGEGATSPEVVDQELRAAGVDVRQMAAEVRQRIAQAQN